MPLTSEKTSSLSYSYSSSPHPTLIPQVQTDVQNHSLWSFFVTFFFATIGGWGAQVLLYWHVWALFESPAKLGLLSASFGLSTLLFLPLCPKIVDRLGPQHAMLVARLLQLLNIASFLLLLIHPVIGYVSVLFYSVVGALSVSIEQPARSIFLFQYARSRNYPIALMLGRLNSISYLGRIVGPLLAVAFLNSHHIVYGYLFCILSILPHIFLCSKGIVSRVRQYRSEPSAHRPLFPEHLFSTWIGAFKPFFGEKKNIITQRLAGTSLLLTIIVGFFLAPYYSQLANYSAHFKPTTYAQALHIDGLQLTAFGSFISHWLHQPIVGAKWYSALVLASALGGIVSVFIQRLLSLGRHPLLIINLFFTCSLISLVGLALSTHVWSIPFAFLTSLFLTTLTVRLQGMGLENSSDENRSLRASVHAFYSIGAPSAGALSLGFLASYTTISSSMLVLFTIGLTLFFAFLYWLHRKSS